MDMDSHSSSPGFRMVTHHPKNGNPPFQIYSPTFPRMVTQLPKDGHCHPPSQGWSPSIPRVLPTIKNWHLDKIMIRWQLPWLVPYHPSSPPRMVTHHPEYGHPPSKRWLPSFQRMVIHHPQDGRLPSLGWSPTISKMLTNQPKDGHLPSTGWLPKYG